MLFEYWLCESLLNILIILVAESDFSTHWDAEILDKGENASLLKTIFRSQKVFHNLKLEFF